jgi:hypothetical protein
MKQSIPDYPLEAGVSRKRLSSRKYKFWTVAVLRKMMADLPDDARIWIHRYDSSEDEFFIRPFELLSSIDKDVFLG